MRILVTGFDPFGGESVNPAYEAVKLLPDAISGAEIVKLEIPTMFVKSVQAVTEAIDKYRPDVVINVGQAGGRPCVTVEKVAVNIADAVIADNAGNQPCDEPLVPDGPAAYFSTLPVKEIIEYVRRRGLPCGISYSAGTYVCNCVMYNVLHLAKQHYPNMRAGFIHVPYECGQIASKSGYGAGMPSMPVETIAKTLEYAVEAVVGSMRGEFYG